MTIQGEIAGSRRHLQTLREHAARSAGRISLCRLGLLLALICLAASAAHARAPAGGHNDAAAAISASELPPEAQEVLRLIKLGGPFRYSKDGTVFGNRERRLPPQAYGYYREYTVPTPGERDRGPRRIIAGRKGDFYYTDDHYRRFKRIVE
jgi:ribonuclease T1